MSVRVMSWVWEHSRSRGNARLVLLAIADCADDSGGNAWPSMAALIRKTGLSERTIQSAFATLAKLGELTAARNAGPHGCNRYRVRMDTHRDTRTPAESAPPQNPHPAESAPTPAGSAPPPPQELRGTPAESAPGTVLEPSIEPSPEPSSSRRTRKRADVAVPERPDVEQLCDHLADRIEANGCLRPTVTKRWRDSARLLLDKDGRTVDQVIRAIDWCQDDEFWRGNVLSMTKLRQQYDRLRLAAQRHRERAGPTTGDIDWQAAMARAEAREAAAR